MNYYNQAGDIVSLTSQLSGLIAGLKSLNVDLGNVIYEITTLENKLEDLKSAKSVLQAKSPRTMADDGMLAFISTQIPKLEDDIAPLRTEKQSILNKITSIENQIDVLRGKIADLQQKLNVPQEQLDEIEADLAELDQEQQDIVTERETILAAEAKLSKTTKMALLGAGAFVLLLLLLFRKRT